MKQTNKIILKQTLFLDFFPLLRIFVSIRVVCFVSRRNPVLVLRYSTPVVGRWCKAMGCLQRLRIWRVISLGPQTSFSQNNPLVLQEILSEQENEFLPRWSLTVFVALHHHVLFINGWIISFPNAQK